MQFKNIKKEKNTKINTNTKFEPVTGETVVGSDLSGKKSLKIITLSGTESVTKNMTVYEYGDDIIVVDVGVGFPDSDMLGVDVVIPDFSYLLENSHKVKAIFITHAHEDHIGAVPYLLKELNVPIYANRLVQGFLRERLKEKRFSGIGDNVSYHLIEAEGTVKGEDNSTAEVGPFKIKAFRLNHSVPMSMGFAISTPEGTVLHMADYKIDWTPVLDRPIDLGTISELGEQGVLCLLSDCLGVTTEGYTKSESTLSGTFHDLFESASDRQILVTTISSNISRMHQITQAAAKLGRRVVLAGRSIEQSVKVAQSLGYLDFPDDMFVKEDDAASYLQKDLVYIIAGCYGQQGSALDRLARGEHQSLILENDALVVFSADPNPPGVAEDVERVMDQLTLSGAEVIYSKIQENLHVSGHGTKGDLVTIASIVHPKYFIPIGGTITKARAYKNMVESLGFNPNTVFESLEGDIIEFSKGFAKKSGRLAVKAVYVDGTGTTGPVVLKDREQLSNEGVFVVVIPSVNGKLQKGKAEVITRGFIYVKENKTLMGQSRDVVNKVLEKLDGVDDWNTIRGKIEKDVEKFLYRETGRNPLIIVHSINV
jgi:ribonuclease J